jgi:hypothetical protein
MAPMSSPEAAVPVADEAPAKTSSAESLTLEPESAVAWAPPELGASRPHGTPEPGPEAAPREAAAGSAVAAAADPADDGFY